MLAEDKGQLFPISRWRCSFKNPPTYPDASRCIYSQSGYFFLENQNCFLRLLGSSNMLQCYKKVLFSIPKNLDVVKSGHVPWLFHFTLKRAYVLQLCVSIIFAMMFCSVLWTFCLKKIKELALHAYECSPVSTLKAYFGTSVTGKKSNVNTHWYVFQ